jgi:hypothetical protein
MSLWSRMVNPVPKAAWLHSLRLDAVFGWRQILKKKAASAAAVLSYDYWTRRFGRDPKVVGRAFHMAGRVYEIVGVAGKPFTGTETGAITDVFIPMMMKNPKTLESSSNFWLRTLVELKPGVA